ncbi:MAG: fimbrillin family protein [Prevotella sp.]|nr:fimbrillin family protein [Prevotella sp.]
MKKLGFLTYAALLAFASCTNEINEEGFVDKANTISFSAYSNKTRAGYTSGDVDISKMKEGSFGVVGYTSDNNLYLGSTDKAIEQVWNSTSNVWDYATPSDLEYWPQENMDFYAYFPYSDQGDVFAQSDASGDVMTINNVTGNQDVLFACEKNQAQTAHVPLRFHHALSKIASVNIQVNQPEVVVKVQRIEFLNTSTKGKIKVDNSGNATYEPTLNTTRSFDFSPSYKEISYSPTTGVELFTNDDNGYIFATNSNLAHNVTGTGKTLWDSQKSSITSNSLSKSDLVCMKLKCKVQVAGTYLVGDASTYGDMYIPMQGISANSLNISDL